MKQLLIVLKPFVKYVLIWITTTLKITSGRELFFLPWLLSVKTICMIFRESVHIVILKWYVAICVWISGLCYVNVFVDPPLVCKIKILRFIFVRKVLKRVGFQSYLQESCFLSYNTIVWVPKTSLILPFLCS